MSANSYPTQASDPVNTKILIVSEDRISGFHRYPFHEIAKQSGVALDEVIARIKAMTEAGVIRRVRQTLLATKLAHGALVAWKIPADKINAAFDFLVANDPFSGHVVLRSTDSEISGHDFKLWTTLKVPKGITMEQHCDILKPVIGAEDYLLMPAQGVFALGVGHMRRRGLEPGAKGDNPAKMQTTTKVELSEEEWRVLLVLKAELSLEEICANPWDGRAASLGMSVEQFCDIAAKLDAKKVIGRFSTFLEHVKPSSTGERVTRFNGLFHWAVPAGMEQQAGAEVGRHFCMTHCYWREGGPRFGNVNIMGVVHGTEKEKVLAHKAAIDAHLASIGIPVLYTAVFWGGRSEIKPSEISPFVHAEWMEKMRTTAPL